MDVLARDWLQGGARGPLDLRECLVVVPTRHAGRRLRAALARLASDHGSAVLSGPLATPEHILPPTAQAASDPLVLALLARRLIAERVRMAALLPASPIEWSFPFALGIAGQLQDLRRQLAEADRDAADLVPLVSDEERDRWRDLAILEAGLRRDLQDLGLEDPLLARRRAARHLPSPPSYSRVVSLFVPDLSPLAALALQSLSSVCDVQLHVLAPESEADRFDAWGRPVPDRWENEPLPLEENQIQVFEQADDETEALAQRILEAERRRRALAVCTPDPGNARALARRLQAERFSLFLPNGVPLSATAPGRLLSAWLDVLRQPTYAAVAAFLRHPDAQDWLLLRLGIDRADGLLSGLDRCHEEHLPSTLEDLVRAASAFPLLLRALEEMNKSMETPLSAFLADLYDARRPAPSAPPDPLLVETAKALAALIQSTDDSARRLPLDPAESINLLQAALRREQMYPRPDPVSPRETIGWLEVQWETSPALLLADLREGIVPETRMGDPFLPDSLRVRAGLSGNRDAFARDLYLARALLASRPPNGIRFLYSRRAANQDPQLPSRLLLACPADDLPARVDLLFARPALRASRPSAPPRPVLKLTPPACPADSIPTSLSVTDFASYLACPFRFYLSRILRMRPEDDRARELDPMGFGSLAHETLKLLKRQPALADEPALESLLLAELDRLARERFGRNPPLALFVQLDSLRQRLRAAAHVHAGSVRDGWRIVSAEETFEAELDGMLLRSRIDRIDRHADDGRVRILDYKTTDAGPRPLETHYQPRKKSWIDLQLPLYRHLYEQLHPGASVSVGYFNLPKASAETAIHELALDGSGGIDLYASALAAARQVIADVRAGRFWPPKSLPPDRDDFALLFAGGDEVIERSPSP